VKKSDIKTGRKSVSAEVFGNFNKKSDFIAKVIEKSEETKSRIEKRMSQSFMFSCLEESEKITVIDAMEEKIFKLFLFFDFI
jgi:cAMP-dependent protein kinase regulator